MFVFWLPVLSRLVSRTSKVKTHFCPQGRVAICYDRQHDLCHRLWQNYFKEKQNTE